MRSDLGMLLQEELAQVGEREAGVENVFDDEHVLALDGLIEILDELDGARGALALAVAGNGDEVEGRVGLDGARKVDEEKRGAFEHADHDQLFAVQVAGDLRAHLGDAIGDLLAGIENVKALGGHGCHADSIARFVLTSPVKIAARNTRSGLGCGERRQASRSTRQNILARLY